MGKEGVKTHPSRPTMLISLWSYFCVAHFKGGGAVGGLQHPQVRFELSNLFRPPAIQPQALGAHKFHCLKLFLILKQLQNMY